MRGLASQDLCSHIPEHASRCARDLQDVLHGAGQVCLGGEENAGNPTFRPLGQEVHLFPAEVRAPELLQEIVDLVYCEA